MPFPRFHSAFLRTLWPLAIALAVYAGLLGAYLIATGGNFTYFVHFAENHRVTEAFGGSAAGLWVHSGGYDGMMYYAIAREPFRITHLYSILDAPLLRYRRILYPLFTYVLSFGQPGLITPMLLFVNVIATLLSGYLLQRLVTAHGLGLGWTLLYYLHPGILFSLMWDLPVAPALLFVLMSVWWYQRGWYGRAMLCVSAAWFTWEVVAAPVMIGYLGYECLVCLKRRHTAGKFPWVVVLPLALASVWEVALKRLFPTNTNYGVLRNLGYPGVGWWMS